MKTFYQVLANSLIATVTNNFVWFAIVFWSYLETQSVITTSFVGGLYLVATALSGIWFGSIVDHHKKKSVMMISSLLSLIAFIIGLAIYLSTPQSYFTNINSPILWVFICILMLGVIVGNLRNIALPTLVTILVPENMRDRSNGLSGTMNGISFAITSVASGLILAYGGMVTVLIVAVTTTMLAALHLSFVTITEKLLPNNESHPQKIDLKGTIKAVSAIPGLFALIFFTTFNNFLGGVFMSLMDAYGLSLMPVQAWGLLWGVLSLGFIIGGLIIAKRGLGKNPLRTLFIANIIMWTSAIFFTIQPWIWLLAVGMFIWICLVPFAEASEQTIIQKVVPVERQGRVFGFAQSMEQAASPLTAFFIGPIAQLIFIPFMTTGAGVDLIGYWYGIGTARGIALVFSLAGITGLIITLFAMRTTSYKRLSARYLA